MGQSVPVESIVRAIRENRCLLLNYGNYSRVVEPYALGRSADGTEVLCAYQVSGGDEAQVTTGWKVFDVAAVRGATVVTGRFTGERAMPPELVPGAVAERVTNDPTLAPPHGGPERRAHPRSSG